MADAGQDLAKRGDRSPAPSASQVDPLDEPSAEWGWHGGFPRATLIAGWVSVASMLLMLIGNHEGRVEDLWLVGIALVMAFGLIMHSLKQRNSWRR